jgi:hypothetical protein
MYTCFIHGLNFSDLENFSYPAQLRQAYIIKKGCQTIRILIFITVETY